DTYDLQLRIVSPQGTRLEKAEENTLDVEALIREEVGTDAVSITSAFVGMHSPNTPINPIFLFTAGSHESVLQVSIDRDKYPGPSDDLKEQLRKAIAGRFPELTISFEPMEMVEKMMSQGATTPVSVKVAGRNLEQANEHALRIKEALSKDPKFRDVRIVEPVDYPAIEIEVDRERAGQFDLTMEEVSKALTAATSSTRFTNKNMWVDPRSGLTFQVQVQVPEKQLQSLNALRSLPLRSGGARPILEDVAEIKLVTRPGQVNRQGPNRYVTVAAYSHKTDLGSAARAVDAAIASAGETPRGLLVQTFGSLELLKETLSRLQSGLLIAVTVIFLML